MSIENFYRAAAPLRRTCCECQTIDFHIHTDGHEWLCSKCASTAAMRDYHALFDPAPADAYCNAIRHPVPTLATVKETAGPRALCRECVDREIQRIREAMSR